MRTIKVAQIIAKAERDFLAPEGTRLWLTTFLPDEDTNEGHYRLNIEVPLEFAAQAEDAIALVCERIVAALRPEPGEGAPR